MVWIPTSIAWPCRCFVLHRSCRCFVLHRSFVRLHSLVVGCARWSSSMQRMAEGSYVEGSCSSVGRWSDRWSSVVGRGRRSFECVRHRSVSRPCGERDYHEGMFVSRCFFSVRALLVAVCFLVLTGLSFVGVGFVHCAMVDELGTRWSMFL